MTLKSEALINSMAPLLKDNGKEIVAKVGAIYMFEISKAAGEEPQYWTIDLKNGNGTSHVLSYSHRLR